MRGLVVDAVEGIRPYLQALYGTGFRIGVGTHYEEVVVGMVGAAGNALLTAIGDAVDLASPIGAANTHMGMSRQTPTAHVAPHISHGQTLPGRLSR